MLHEHCRSAQQRSPRAIQKATTNHQDSQSYNMYDILSEAVVREPKCEEDDSFSRSCKSCSQLENCTPRLTEDRLGDAFELHSVLVVL